MLKKLSVLGLPRGANIRPQGEDVKKGDRIIARGTRMRPGEVGMLAILAKSFVFVHQRPRVAIGLGDTIRPVHVAGKGRAVFEGKNVTRFMSCNVHRPSQALTIVICPRARITVAMNRPDTNAVLGAGLAQDIVVRSVRAQIAGRKAQIRQRVVRSIGA